MDAEIAATEAAVGHRRVGPSLVIRRPDRARLAAWVTHVRVGGCGDLLEGPLIRVCQISDAACHERAEILRVDELARCSRLVDKSHSIALYRGEP